jgi:hypothetical protein
LATKPLTSSATKTAIFAPEPRNPIINCIKLLF